MKNNLTIYLIKKEFSDINKIKKPEAKLLDESGNYYIFYSHSVARPPERLSNFFNRDDEDIKTSNSKVLLIKSLDLNGTKRIFAITFGYGQHLLNDDVVEEQFGLKIVLNSIESNKIRKISKKDLGRNNKSSVEQMPIEADIEDFGLNINQDLVKLVTGKSNDEYFDNAVITGSDFFNLKAEYDINTIDTLLEHCFNKFCETKYKENFDWIDNIKLVNDNTIIDELNMLIVNAFNNKEMDNVWLTTPNSYEWSQPGGFYIQGQKDRDKLNDDIDFDTFINSFDDCKIESFQKIKNKNIVLKTLDENHSEIQKWKADKCITGTFQYKNKNYSYDNGKWYEISNDFKRQVEEEYERLEVSNLTFPDCSGCSNETQYNEKFAAILSGACCFHPDTINVGESRGRIEPFDIIYTNNLIHIKNETKSTALSHLFNQAQVCCEIMQNKKIRDEVGLKLAGKGFSFDSNNFDSRNYNVVLGIITKKEGLLPKIPFFSKVAIRYAFRNISNMGYHLKIKNIF